MACNSGPRVENTDLIANMDLGNTKSFDYSSSTSSWFGRGRFNYFSRFSGTLYNAPTFHSRGIRSFFSFGGSNHYASIPHSSLFNRTAVTISCWVNLNTTTKEMVLISKRTSGTAGSYHLYITSSGVLTFSTFSGGSESTITNTPGFQTNTWYYIAASASSSSRKLYVNGSEVASGSGVTIQDSTSQVAIGRDSYTSARYLNGRVTKVKVYGKQLSDISIAREYRAFRKRHQSIGTIDPTYSVAPAASSVDEGSAVTFNVTTTDVSDNTTLYYTLSGGTGFSSSDLAVPSAVTGTCIITNNSTSVSMTLDSDGTTEGAETCKLTLYTDSARTNQVAQSSDVTINDTSVPSTAGQVVFTSFTIASFNTDFSWTVPTGVTQISAVCVGGGGGGGGNSGTSGNGASAGGGGGLAYGTFSVTSGETLTIRVGGGGAGGASSNTYYAGNGGASYIKRGTTILLQGGGGGGGRSNVATNEQGAGGSSTGTEKDGGGQGGSGGAAKYNAQGAGGGGAGGYSGNGGTENTDGSGGGGAGGNDNNGSSSKNADQNGGGVGLYGQGTNGSDAVDKRGSANLSPSTGDGRMTAAATLQAGTFGGGGGGIEDDTSSGGHAGGSGGIRIIWGNNRSYPSTNVADQ